MLLSYELHFFESDAQGIMRVAIEAWRWAGISHHHACSSSVIRAPQVLHNHGDKVIRTMDAHKHSIIGPKSHWLVFRRTSAPALEETSNFANSASFITVHHVLCRECVQNVDLVSTR